MSEINAAFYEVFENNQEPVELGTLSLSEEPSYKRGDIISLPKANFVGESETIDSQDSMYEVMIASSPDTISVNHVVTIKNYSYYVKKA